MPGPPRRRPVRTASARSRAVASRRSGPGAVSPAAEVGSQHRLVGPDPLGRAVGDDLAEVEHRQVGAHPHHERHVVLDQQDARARRGPARSSRLPNASVSLSSRPEAGSSSSRTVGRAARARPSSTSRACPVGSAPTGWSATACEGEPVEDQVDLVRRLEVARRRRGTAAPGCADATSCAGSRDPPGRCRGRSGTRTPRGAGTSGRCRGGPARACRGPRCRDRRGGRDPRGGGVTPQIGLNSRGLAGAVGSDQPGHLPGFDREVDVVEGQVPAEADGQFVDGQQAHDRPARIGPACAATSASNSSSSKPRPRRGIHRIGAGERRVDAHHVRRRRGSGERLGCHTDQTDRHPGRQQRQAPTSNRMPVPVRVGDLLPRDDQRRWRRRSPSRPGSAGDGRGRSGDRRSASPRTAPAGAARRRRRTRRCRRTCPSCR